MQKFFKIVLVFYALIGCKLTAYAQITAPNRDWARATQYINSPEHQDSLFTFFASNGMLKAKHTTNNPSTFYWYKYNSNIPTPSSRFQLFQTVTNETSSELTNLTEGGYRVVVVDNTDSTETFTAWVFTDNVELNRIDYFNKCQFLELSAITAPTSYDIENDRFVYHDISRTNHPEINTYGRNYFSSVIWDASESRVEFSPSSTLKQVIEKPAPLFNSSYSVEITNVFGRKLNAQTQNINAIASKAIQNIQVEKDGSWTDYETGSSNEALLGIKMESASVNSDSIYWRLSKLNITKLGEEYKTIWRDSSLFSTRTEATPDKRLMKPGYFKIFHMSVNTMSGCKDSVEVEVVVDSSKIKSDAVPNVFTPNNDGLNDYFRFVKPEDNIKSIKTFTIRILSRTGKLIYQYTGNPKEWEGWNGKIDGKGADAAEGVYYFIIEAKGWDDKEFDYGPYKGFLHLYRGK
ncbi:MAG: T9SS type B sorting domain-containing protein [Bacteroidales bacterium]|nr:MAG: T9SS type B sorting domain-containing protein [Bacteroidales bacterium]